MWPESTFLVECSGADPIRRPRTVVLACGDGNESLDALTWTGWGAASPTASGSLVVNDCTPSCDREPQPAALAGTHGVEAAWAVTEHLRREPWPVVTDAELWPRHDHVRHPDTVRGDVAQQVGDDPLEARRGESAVEAGHLQQAGHEAPKASDLRGHELGGRVVAEQFGGADQGGHGGAELVGHIAARRDLRRRQAVVGAQHRLLQPAPMSLLG